MPSSIKKENAKSSKNINNESTEKAITSKYLDDEIPIISAENVNNWSDANKILHYVETKNDDRDQFFKNFMRSLLTEVRKRKGEKFVRDIVGNGGARNSGIATTPKEIVFDAEFAIKHDKKGKALNAKKSIFSGLR